MLQNKRFIAILLLEIVLASSIFADAVNSFSLAERYLEKANTEYEDGNVVNAYKNINMAMKVSNGAVPTNILVFAQTIYARRLEQLQRRYDEQALIEIKTNLEQFPDVGNATIKRLVRQIEAQNAATEKAESKKEQQEFFSRISESAEATQNAVIEQGKQMQEQNQIIQMQTEELRNDSKKTQRNITTILIVVVVIVVVILLISLLIVVIVRASIKHSQIQQQQYAEAFKLLAQNQSQTNRLMLGGITDLYGNGGLKSAGSSRWGVDALPEPEPTPEEKEEVRELAAKCEELSVKIDQTTGRKNNAKNVSELVYKLAMNLGMHQNEAMIYFCATMVYDAGFLGVDPELLAAKNLTDEQRLQIKKHTDLADEYLQFVPKRYWDIFSCAAKMHHENMDGSGPEGLKGDDIPKVARLIRVAESFIALSSKRNYKQICDKETAIAKLEEQPEIYDPEIVAALKDIV